MNNFFDIKINQSAVESINNKFKNQEYQNLLPTLHLKDFLKKLSVDERFIVDWVINLCSPTITGRDENLENLIEIPGQSYRNGDELLLIPTQVLPRPIYEDFLKMQRAMLRDLNVKLMVESGYRSFACQMITFFRFLEFLSFDIEQVLRVVILPGSSQHEDGLNTAIDVIDNSQYLENPFSFADSKAFHWLKFNAKKYNFFLSYPEDNSQGIRFEPWHWQHVL